MSKDDLPDVDELMRRSRPPSRRLLDRIGYFVSGCFGLSIGLGLFLLMGSCGASLAKDPKPWDGLDWFLSITAFSVGGVFAAFFLFAGLFYWFGGHPVIRRAFRRLAETERERSAPPDEPHDA